MIEKLFLQVLTTAAVSSVLLLLLLFPAQRWLEDRYGAQTRYLVWLGLAAVLLLAPLLPRPMAPVRLEVPAYTVPMPQPTQAVENVRPWAAVTTPASPQPVTPPVTQVGTFQMTGPVATPPAVPQPAAHPIAWTELAAWLWLVVVALLLVVQIVRYLVARRKLMKVSVPLDGADKAQLCVLPSLDTPMTLGLLRPVVFLPEGEVSPWAVEHELTHVKRGDLWGKAFLFLTCVFYWFDPLVWQMARVAGRDMEAACDARVIAGFSGEEKRRYGELLFNAARSCKVIPLATRFGRSKEQMKLRLAQLFRSGKRSRALVALLVIAALALTSLVACQEKGEETAPTTDLTARTAYAQVLRDFLSEGLLPDGTQMSLVEWGDPFTNAFAVADVDGDGREELVLRYMTTYVESMRAFILDNSDGGMKLQLTASPRLIFYSNGMVKGVASHNQFGDPVWPYDLYSYDAEADCSQWVCSVFTKCNPDLEEGQGDQTPADENKSDADTVYVIEYDRNRESMDEAEYQAWWKEQMGDATELELTYLPITYANIAALLGEEPSEALIPLEELEKKYAISGYYPGFTFDTVSRDGRDWYRLTQNDGFYTLYVDPTETCLRAEMEDPTDDHDRKRDIRLYDLPRFLPTGVGDQWTEFTVRDVTGDGVDDLIVRVASGGTGAHGEYVRVVDAHRERVYALSDLTGASLAEELLARLEAEVLSVEAGFARCAVSLSGQTPQVGQCPVKSDITVETCDATVCEGEDYFSLEPMGDCLLAELYFTIADGAPGFYLGSVSVPVRYDAATGPDLTQATLTLFEPNDLASELMAVALDFFALKRDAVNGVALPPEVADLPLGWELTARAQAMRAHHAAKGTHIVSIETEYEGFVVHWVQGNAAMVSLYERTWINYNNGQGEEATDRMGTGRWHDVALTCGDGGYAVTRDASREIEDTNYQSQLFPVSDKFNWQGQEYICMSDAVGVRVEFPPEWEDYFTFKVTDAFLQSGQPCPVLELVPTISASDPTLDATLARIFWLPRGDAAAGGDGKILVTLLVTDQGAYVCEVNTALSSALGPEDGELRTICETVQNGILDCQWWFEDLANR